ncbi:MAG: hypothetical protein LLG04_03065 [Parachlamydia sp.]|nr:hypothetical protein [Parachlamydia sp.]
MIELTPAAACTLYLGATLAFLLGLWIYHHYSSRHKKIITVAHKLHVCEYCHFAYLAELGKDVTQCPQCQSFNK